MKEEIKPLTKSYGGLAHLVEQVLCKHQVKGSNPLTSTSQPNLANVVGRRQGNKIVCGPRQ